MSNKRVYGVGINNANYSVQHFKRVFIDGSLKIQQTWLCPFYRTWKGMLERCYSKREQARHPTYTGCSVCEEWLTFSNFKAWMETQDWEGKQLDKDILIFDNKTYSPEACAFVTSATNKFLTDRAAERGKYPIGVNFDKSCNKFRAQCNNPFTKDRGYLGLFDTAEEAHYAWKKKKNELAIQLASIQTDERVATALVNRYKYE